jgi:hypothetical protein
VLRALDDLPPAHHGRLRQLVDRSRQWLRQSQNADGSWGFYGQPTPEETAYGLLALLASRELDERDGDRCQAAATFLEAAVRNHAPNPPLWIDKCLYIPPLVVNAAIEAALTAWKLRNNTMKRS